MSVIAAVAADRDPSPTLRPSTFLARRGPVSFHETLGPRARSTPTWDQAVAGSGPVSPVLPKSEGAGLDTGHASPLEFWSDGAPSRRPPRLAETALGTNSTSPAAKGSRRRHREASTGGSKEAGCRGTPLATSPLATGGKGGRYPGLCWLDPRVSMEPPGRASGEGHLAAVDLRAVSSPAR